MYGTLCQRCVTFSFYVTKLVKIYFLIFLGVTERSRLLAEIADDLEAVKGEMEERGSSMTDGTPLVNVRKSLARMKQETVNMDVRIGVVQHTLLQAKLKDKSDMQRDAYNWSAGSTSQDAYYH